MASSAGASPNPPSSTYANLRGTRRILRVRNQLVKFVPSVFSLSFSRNDPKLNVGRGAAIYKVDSQGYIFRLLFIMWSFNFNLKILESSHLDKHLSI